MNYEEVLENATNAVLQLKGHLLDVLTIKKPYDLQAAIALSKVISKLSPIVGNILESTLTQYLNAQKVWPDGCTWKRQDPDFPDIVLTGIPEPRPGLEVKAWFPLATEITARFRDSQALLQNHNTRIVVICWMPDSVIAGKPKVVDIFVCDAIEFAIARDNHYHRPPAYIVVEPEDTRLRTQNLQQKNCNGYGFQGNEKQRQEAQSLIDTWGANGKAYSTTPEYQTLLRELMGRFPYRLDTNFAKIDRIVLGSLEDFKRRTLNTIFIDRTIQSWIKAIRISEPQALTKLIDPTSSIPIE